MAMDDGRKVKGFDEMNKDMDRMKRNVDELKRKKSVSLSELLNASFLNKHTRFSSAEEMLVSGGLLKETEPLTREKLESIPIKDLDELVSKESSFPTWDTMFKAAAGEYLRKRVVDGT